MSRLGVRGGRAILAGLLVAVLLFAGFVFWNSAARDSVPGVLADGELLVDSDLVVAVEDPTPFDQFVDAAPLVDIPDFGRGWSAVSEHAAMEIARTSGRVVEDVSQRDATSAVYALPDGHWAIAQSFATEFVPVPRGEDGASAWVLVDPELNVGVESLEPELVAGTASYSAGDGSDVVLASFTGLGSTVTVNVLWDGYLPHGTVDGARVTYESVAPDVDLMVESRVSGFEVFLVAHSPAGLAAAEKLPFVFEVSGGSFGVPEQGAVAVFDTSGVQVANIPVPRAWDAKQDVLMSSPVLDQPGRADSLTPEDFVNIELDVETSFEAVGQRLTVFLAVDSASNGNLLEFPVILDPTYETLSPHTLMSFDTRVQNGVTRNMSGDAELTLGTWNGGANIVRPFLNFSTSPITNRDLISATLYLWNHHSFSCSARSWSVHLSDGVSTATRWTNQPTVYSSPVSSSSSTLGYSSSCNDGWVSVNVTSQVQYFKSQGITSATIALRTNETDSYSWKRFNSRNASSNQPKIVYVVNRVPNVPTAVSYVPATATERGRFQAKVTDPDGADVMVSARFSAQRRALGSTGAWEPVFDKAQGQAVLSGGFSVRELDLIGGFEYRVRAWSHDGRVESASASSWVTVQLPVDSDFIDLPDSADGDV